MKKSSPPAVRPSSVSMVPFLLGWGGLFAVLSLQFERFVPAFEAGVPVYWIFSGFLLGAVLGFFLNRWWRKQKGRTFTVPFVGTLLFFTFFSSLVGVLVGMTVFGMGYTFNFAGLTGYESIGLFSGIVGSFLGPVVGYALLGGNLGARHKWGWPAVTVGLILEVLGISVIGGANSWGLLFLFFPFFALLVVHYGDRA